jgi:hypothetical protein
MTDRTYEAWVWALQTGKYELAGVLGERLVGLLHSSQ